MFSFVALLALVAAATAAPAELNAKAAPISEVSPVITLCTGAFPSGGCAQFSVIADNCVDLTGGKSVLDKTITGIQIPIGFICTLFLNFGCSDGPTATVILTGGTFNLATQAVSNGLGSAVNFNDQTSSYSCSTLD